MNGPVGFIGLGAMGNPIATRLLSMGYSVVAYDRSPQAVRSIVAAGAVAATSVRAVGSACQTVLTSLPTAEVVEEVALGADGLIRTMPPKSVLIDLSSSKPSTTRRISVALAQRDIALLDAPVSRGVAAARNGDLSIMVGGDASVLDDCRSVLAAIGSEILHVGPVSTGHAVKALNNLLSATHLVAAIEAVLVAVRLGLDPEALIVALNRGTGRSTVTDERFHRYIVSRTYRSDFSLALMYKDIQTAVELAHELDVPLFATDLTRQLYAMAAGSQYANGDNQEMARFLESLLGQDMFPAS